MKWTSLKSTNPNAKLTIADAKPTPITGFIQITRLLKNVLFNMNKRILVMDEIYKHYLKLNFI